MLNLLKCPILFSRYFFARLDSLSRHRLVSIIIVAFLSFGGSWLFSAFRGIPVPYVQDEFSYLLAGDTFAHGRITNSTPPMWEHFETFHELMKPTYMSKLPPCQGLFLAVGQAIFGHPIYGVWLSAGMMCAAICWMLYAWVSPRWALVGGLVAVLQFGIFTYWSQSYWGGAPAALGGALAFGALPRIIKYQRLRDTLFLGIGIGILANTRLLEGILLGIPLGCLLLPWKMRWQWVDNRRLMKNILLPLSFLILAIAILTGTYNKKITGNAFELPYILYEKQYAPLPMFIWQSLAPPIHYNHKALADYESTWTVNYYLKKRTWKGLVRDIYEDSVCIGMFFFGFPLALPSLTIVVLLFCSRKTAGRYIISLCIILFLIGMLPFQAKAHYFSPFTCLAVLLITIGLRGLFWLGFRQQRIGPVMVIFLISLQLLLNILLTPVQPAVKSLARSIPSSQINLPRIFSREGLKDILMKRGGKYLVIVRYPWWHNFFREWVYNEADIDHAPIVWARDMGVDKNAELMQYFKDRQVLYINISWEIKNFPYYPNRQ